MFGKKKKKVNSELQLEKAQRSHAEELFKLQLLYKEQYHKLKLETEKQISDEKIKANEQVSKMERDYERKLLELKSGYEKDLSDFKTKAARDYYEQLKTEFTELQKNGDKNSKFIQDLALKMFERAPKPEFALEYREVKNRDGDVSKSTD